MLESHHAVAWTRAQGKGCAGYIDRRESEADKCTTRRFPAARIGAREAAERTTQPVSAGPQAAIERLSTADNAGPKEITMLAQNLKTPADLGIEDKWFEALLKLLGMLERGELQHTSTAKLKPLSDDRVNPQVGLFNMNRWSVAFECGTVCC